MERFHKFTSKISTRIVLSFCGIIAVSLLISIIFLHFQNIAVFSQEELVEMASHSNQQGQKASAQSLREVTLEATKYYTGLVFMCVVIAFGIVFLYVEPKILRRLVALSKNIEQLSSGRLEQEINAEGRDEISEMMHSLEAFRLKLLEKQKSEEELLEMRDRLEENEKRYLLTTRAARIGLWDWNPITNETFFNDEWYTMLGYFPGELPATFETFENLCHPDDFKKCTQAISEHFDTGRDYKISFRMQHKNGNWIWVLSNGKVTNWDGDGRPQRMSGVHTDITERKKANDELQRMKRSLEVEIESRTIEYKEQKLIAERANKAKDEFLANMSHELRTPLNSILGLTNILIDNQKVSNDIRKDLKVIKSASNSLLGIVNDVLDISKIEAGAIELEDGSFNVAEVLYSVWAQLSPLAQQKKLDFKNNFSEYAHVSVMGDSFRFRQIMVNLIGNAIKYTEDGLIDVNIVFREHDVSTQTKKFICEIKDTGIGIPADKLPTIFDKFTQAETTSNRKFQGTGLGLNITKLLVDKMGGDIRVHSELGIGSVFILSIPFQRAEGLVNFESEEKDFSLDSSPKQKKNFNDARILIAEDHDLNRLYMDKLMQKLNCGYFAFAEDGGKALSAYKKEKWDLILMDCHMPEMNGFEVTEKIRKLEKQSGSYVPIVAVTADAMDATRQLCTEAGMDLYLSKPIDERQFVSVLKNWFEFEEIGNLSTGDSDLDQNVIDFSLLKEYSNGDFEFERKLVQSFYHTGSLDINILKENTDPENHDIFTEAAHKLKGSSAFIGANQLSALCQKAQIIDKKMSSENRKKIFAEIEKEFSNVEGYLKAQDYLE